MKCIMQKDYIKQSWKIFNEISKGKKCEHSDLSDFVVTNEYTINHKKVTSNKSNSSCIHDKILNMKYDRTYVYEHLITVRLQNAVGVPPENSQGHSLEQAITLALILISHSKSAATTKKLDRRFRHGAGRLDSNRLED